MNRPRLRIVLPVAVLATALAPLLRQTPAGAWLPDLWLVLLLVVVPVPAPDSWKRPMGFVLGLGFLRSSVTALSPFVSWGGLGLALFVRETLSRRLSEYNPLLRWLTYFAAAIPQAVLDRIAAQALGVSLATGDAWVRCLLTGLFMAILQRPRGRLRRMRSKQG